MPMLYYERKARKQGFRIIIGVDEAGRGPLAGPVVASAVFLKKNNFRNKIRDSKQLTPLQREKAFLEIFEKAYIGIGIINESVIDAINILQATHQAMSIAVTRLIAQLPYSRRTHKNFHRKVCVLVDGRSFQTNLPYAFKTIIKGDEKSLSIASASIIAKVARDRIIHMYDKVFPQYGFCRHKGYPTKAHRLAIREHGPSLIHRKTFKNS